MSYYVGCDSTSGFNGKGKKKCFNLMTSRDRFVKSFQNIGKFETLTDESEAIMSEYVSLLFGSKLLCVNDARVELFKRGKFSEELLPPNDDCLKRHLQRANYQAFVWKSCLSQFIPNVNVNDHGWIVTDDLISINWKTRNVAGDLLFQSIFCKCKTGCKKMQCVCRKNKMNCSLMCQCLSCENKKPVDNKPGKSSDELDSCSDESDIGSDIEFSIEENIFE